MEETVTLTIKQVKELCDHGHSAYLLALPVEQGQRDRNGQHVYHACVEFRMDNFLAVDLVGIVIEYRLNNVPHKRVTIPLKLLLEWNEKIAAALEHLGREKAVAK